MGCLPQAIIADHSVFFLNTLNNEQFCRFVLFVCLYSPLFLKYLNIAEIGVKH